MTEYFFQIAIKEFLKVWENVNAVTTENKNIMQLNI